jgi:hypothetical protein
MGRVLVWLVGLWLVVVRWWFGWVGVVIGWCGGWWGRFVVGGGSLGGLVGWLVWWLVGVVVGGHGWLLWRHWWVGRLVGWLVGWLVWFARYCCIFSNELYSSVACWCSACWLQVRNVAVGSYQ